MSNSKPAGPPKGSGAAKPKPQPAPEDRTHDSTSAVDDNPAPGAPPSISSEVAAALVTQPCRCPDGQCAVATLDKSRCHCRIGAEAPEPEPVPPAEELLNQIADIICEQDGVDPKAFYLGETNRHWRMPAAITHVRIFNLLVNKAMGDD